MELKRRKFRVAAYAALMAAVCLVCVVQAGAQQQPAQSSEAPKIIRKSGGVLQGTATRRVEPAYPPLAKAARISGAVVVELTIDESGDVISARPVSGHPLLKDAAVQAAQGWKFAPTKLQDVPVKVIGNITFNFMMDVEQGITLEAAEKAVEEHPDSAQAHYDLGIALDQKGRRLEAIQALKDAIGIDPSLEIGYRKLGEYLAMMGPDREAEAIDTLKQAIKLNPRDLQVQLTLGSVYSRTHRYQEAVELYQETIRENPSVGMLYIELGGAYASLENFDRAEDAYKQGLRIVPSYVDGYITLSKLYMKQDRTREAIETLKQATAVAPKYDGAHLALGMAYAKSGDKKSAMDEYEVLKASNPRMAEELLKAINK